MDRTEAREVARRCLEPYTTMKYDDVVQDVGSRKAVHVTSDAGRRYAIDIEIGWDDGPDGDIRIVALADDSTVWSATFPVTESWIIEKS